jgi:hypothetical protein
MWEFAGHVTDPVVTRMKRVRDPRDRCGASGDPMSDSTAVHVKGLYKVFGRRAREGVKRLQGGATRDSLGDGTTAAVIDSSFDVKRGEISMGSSSRQPDR